MAFANSRRRSVAAALLALASTAGAASAQQGNLNVKLEGLSLGNILSGPNIELPLAKPAMENPTKSGADTAKPTGRPRVVLLAFWNANSPAGVNTLLLLTRMKTEYAGVNLQIVAAHQQLKPKDAKPKEEPKAAAKAAPAPKAAPKAKPAAKDEPEAADEIGADEIRGKAESCGATYTVAESAELAGAGPFIPPHVVIWDHTGKCVFRGLPGDMEHALKQACNRCPLVQVDGKDIGRVATLVEQLNNGTGPAQVAQSARRYIGGNDYIASRHAQGLIDRLNAEVERRLNEAAAVKETDPVAHYNMLQLIVKNFGGVDALRKAAEQFSAIKADPKFAVEKRAFEMLEAVRFQELSLKSPGKGPVDPRDPEYQKLNRDGLRKMQGLVETMRKGAPQSRATQEAIKIGLSHGLEVDADPAVEKTPVKAERPAAKK